MRLSLESHAAILRIIHCEELALEFAAANQPGYVTTIRNMIADIRVEVAYDVLCEAIEYVKSIPASPL